MSDGMPDAMAVTIAAVAAAADAAHTASSRRRRLECLAYRNRVQSLRHCHRRLARTAASRSQDYELWYSSGSFSFGWCFRRCTPSTQARAQARQAKSHDEVHVEAQGQDEDQDQGQDQESNKVLRFRSWARAERLHRPMPTCT